MFKNKKDSQENSPEEANKKRKKSVKAISTWYKDRYQVMIIQRNILLLMTVVTLGAIVFCALTIQYLTKQRTIEPFVIEISEKTGVATVVDQQSVEKFKADEVITRYFIVHYIKSRESFDITRYKHNYNNIVRLLSTGGIYNNFVWSLQLNTDKSIVARLGKAIVRDVKILSISFLKQEPGAQGRNVQVRIKTEDRSRGGNLISSANFIINMEFDFVDMNLKIEDRYINPLGFVVTSYIIDEEVI